VRATPERTLTQRELNRALLARQLLLERGRLSLPRALERVAGLQAQYAPSMYIGLWSRVDGLERHQLTRALERRTVVQATLMRATIHLVSARDYWLFAVGVRRAIQDWWLKLQKGRVDLRDLEERSARLRAKLADGPKSRAELDELESGWAGIWGELVRVPPSGTWERRRADLFAAAADWVGPCTASESEGIEHLVRRYLGGFGPASRNDIASWTGIPLTQLKPTLERLRLRRFRDEQRTELLDLPRAPLPDGGTPAPVRFLPTWDATLLVHARRTGILPERYRPLVFNTKNPQSIATFLVDGAVAGRWREEGGRVRLEPFDPLPRQARRELEAEAARLERFLS
jgi:Winged helix DNA-binding domain